jgi:hypothetical protein
VAKIQSLLDELRSPNKTGGHTTDRGIYCASIYYARSAYLHAQNHQTNMLADNDDVSLNLQMLDDNKVRKETALFRAHTM